MAGDPQAPPVTEAKTPESSPWIPFYTDINDTPKYWEEYNRFAEEYDKDLCSEVGAHLDNILIFVRIRLTDSTIASDDSLKAALFSAVLTAFLIEAYALGQLGRWRY